MARAAGLLSAQRIFLIGTGANVGTFVNRYEPWKLGINIVGCRFLTPVVASAPVEERRAILDRDLAEAATSVRQLEPDAIFVLLPWSATETIDRCAETFVSLPVEIHLGTRADSVQIRGSQALHARTGREPAIDPPAADPPRDHPETRFRSRLARLARSSRRRRF